MLEQSSTQTPHAAPAPKSRPEPEAAHTTAADDGKSLTQSAGQAVQSVSALYEAADSALQQQVDTNPYATLAAAAAVGFVLGGGMRSPIGQLLVRLSVRAFGPPLVNAALHTVLERATASFDPGAGPGRAG